MNCQKHLFDLPDDIHYLNGAYMSPLMRSVYEAGVAGMKRKFDPSKFHSEDFFTLANEVKAKFAKLIHASPQQIAIIPSASYGLKSALNNLPLDTGNHALIVGNEFPSDYYSILTWCKRNKKELHVVEAPATRQGRGETWTRRILEKITVQTSALILSSIHWTDGTKFDLEKIGSQCRITNTRFIVDGTQSVGAIPIDVAAFKIDALVCAAYKWLMGPYSIGLAYYSEEFNNGTPLEETWMNRSNAFDFTNLTRYVDDYRPGAARYDVGEFSNPVLLPMLDAALLQLSVWGPEAVQDYCLGLIRPLLDCLQNNDYWIEDQEYRANHLFGIVIPSAIDKNKLLAELERNKIFVSLRGDGIRVSPHVYNEEKDIDALMETLQRKSIRA